MRMRARGRHAAAHVELAQAVFDTSPARCPGCDVVHRAGSRARAAAQEIDSLNGFIAREGERLAIAVPGKVHALVRLLEDELAEG